MKTVISGFYGHMGREVAKIVEGLEGAELLCGVDITARPGDETCVAKFDDIPGTPDCIIDFSHHSATADLLAYAVGNSVPVVIATTGHTPEEIDAIRVAAGKIPVFLSANMSTGVALLVRLAKQTAAAMPGADIEIIEKHHNRKLDSPSGTAKLLFDAVKQVRPDAYMLCGRSGHSKRERGEIGIHSIRLADVVGEHEVIVATPTQTITLKHEAHSRAIFAEGAVVAAEFLVGKPAGLYTMESMLG